MSETQGNTGSSSPASAAPLGAAHGSNAVTPTPKVAPAPPKVIPPTSTTPTTSKPNSTTPMQFLSKDIGAWSARQENPFAEQNRRAAAEQTAKQQAKLQLKEQFKKYLPIANYVVVGVSTFLVLLFSILWLVGVFIPTPEIAGDSTDDINNYVNALQEIYDDFNENPKIVKKAVNNTLRTDNGKKYHDAARLGQALFSQDNALYRDAVNAAHDVAAAESLTLYERLRLYNVFYYSGYYAGDKELSEVYDPVVSELIYELTDGGTKEL